MSYSQLKKFQILSELGEGGFGTVYRAQDRDTGELVAIKKMLTSSHEEPRDVTMLRKLDHQHVVALRGHFLSTSQDVDGNSETHHQVVLELCLTDLTDVVRKGLLRTVDEVKLVVYECLEGLSYIHSRNLIHRDIKPDNILIGINGEVKIGDLGLAVGKNESRGCSGTPGYMAPEVVFGSRDYGTAVDIWSMSLVLFFVIYQEKCFSHGHSSDLNVSNDLIEIFGQLSAQDFPGLTLPNLCPGWPP